MIRPININLNAAHPELPLVEATTFTGAPSSVFIRGVPKAVGNWSITAVSVAVTYPDNTTTARAAVESAEGVWVATIPGTATSGRTAAGFKIMADGIDENGDAVTGYVLGFADFSVLSFTPVPAPGGTFYLLRYFDQAPATPKEGDVAKIDGVLKFYNGSAWETFAASVTLDDAVTPTSANGVKSSGIWSAIWGALSALPTGFTSLYDWCVAQIAKLRGKTDLNVYGYGNASVTFPDGFSITYISDTYTAPSGGETIEFYGPITSTAVPQYNFWVPYEYKDATNFDPAAQTVWCLYGSIGNSAPNYLMYRTGASYSIANWNTVDPTLTLSYGEATGDAPTMARPLGATGDTLAKVSQMNTALAGKANDNAVVHKTGEETVGGDKTFTGTDMFYDLTISHPQGNGYIRFLAQPYENRVLVSFSDPVSGSMGSLFMPIMSTSAGTLAVIENIAPDAFGALYDGATVDINTLYCYQGRLYRCILGYTFQSGDSYPSDDTTHWTLATVEDVLAALRTAMAGKANTSDLNAKLDSTSAAPAFSSDSSTQYPVGSHCTYQGKLYVCTTATTGGTWVAGSWTMDTMTDPDAVLDITAQNQLRVVAKDGTVLWAQGYDLASTSSATLACDATNNFTFADGATTQAFTLPTAPSGKVGDFGLDIDNSANTGAATMTLTGLDTTFSVVVPEGESLNDMLAIAAGELARFYISLSTFRVNNLPTWHIVKQVVENGGAQS